MKIDYILQSIEQGDLNLGKIQNEYLLTCSNQHPNKNWCLDLIQFEYSTLKQNEEENSTTKELKKE